MDPRLEQRTDSPGQGLGGSLALLHPLSNLLSPPLSADVGGFFKNPEPELYAGTRWVPASHSSRLMPTWTLVGENRGYYRLSTMT